jgi:hypothetical protein
MVELFDESKIIGVPTAFQAFFGNPAAGSDTVFCPDSDTVEIDIVRGNEKLAAMVPRGTVSRSIGTKQRDIQLEKYTNVARVFPLVEEDGNISAADLLKKLPGEGPYDQVLTRRDRLRWRALKIHMESIRKSIRTFEYLASQSILTGKMPAMLGTVGDSLLYDFYRNPDNIFSVPTAWDDTAAVIMSDIDAACDLIRVNGHTNPDFCGVGGAAMDAFIKDDIVQVRADNRRIELIEVSTNSPVPPRFNRFIEAGWIARGRLRTPKGYTLWLFTYIDGYTDDNGDFANYMPVDQAIVCDCMARCDRYFGPAEVLPVTAQRAAFYQENFGFNLNAPALPMKIKNPSGVIMPEMFMPYAYGAVDYTNITHRVQSAPIFSTTHTDAFVTLTDLIIPAP